MKIIGLTGTIASGKSTVAALLAKAFIPVIDADALAYDLTKKGSPALKEIARIFGTEVLDFQGELDRKKLGKLVFNNDAMLKKLESILHPLIEQQRKKLLATYAEQGHDIAVYMAPLIFEKNIHKTLDKTILVTAEKEILQDRLMKRNNLSAQEAQNRIDIQLGEDDKIKLADEVIKNNGSLLQLQENLSKAWLKLTGQNIHFEP